MNIWIDLANSPQVLFFRPIIALLQSRGHQLRITSRDFAQTVALADEYGMVHTPIGRHGGKKWTRIIQTSVGRALGLRNWVRKQPEFDLAVSHNAYTQALAATICNIPFVTLMDYEYQPLNHFCFRLAKRVIVPASFPDEMLRKFGAANKTFKFDGLKEEIYLADFQPEANFLKSQSLCPEKINIVVRPPAPWTAYHRFENSLFDDVLSFLAKSENSTIIFLPRIPSQGDWARKLGFSNLIVPPKTLNGPNLLYAADLVISGGGTMNREAATLGTPTYTVFKGKMGAVDKFLINSRRMTQVSEISDINQIKIEKKRSQQDMIRSPGLVEQVTDFILGGAAG
jgi:uncharacterized protein